LRPKLYKGDMFLTHWYIAQKMLKRMVNLTVQPNMESN